MNVVLNYKPLIKDFPIHELLASTEISQVSNALKNIFEHLKKTKNVHYPIQRYLRLIEAISRDLCNKVLEILRAKQIMNLSYAEFDKLTNECRALFILWDDQFSKLREIIRELARKRKQEDVPLRVNVETKALQERILNIRTFRKQHEELREVIERVCQRIVFSHSICHFTLASRIHILDTLN
jgi:dynein heavy chain 1